MLSLRLGVVGSLVIHRLSCAVFLLGVFLLLVSIFLSSLLRPNIQNHADPSHNSCISARRRRRRGQIPFRGTGWLANHGPAVYNPNPYPSGGGHSTTTGTTTTGTTGGYNPNAAQRPVPQTGAAASYYANYAPPPPMYSPNPNATDGGTTTTNTTGGNTQYTEQQNGRIELMGPQPTYSATK